MPRLFKVLLAVLAESFNGHQTMTLVTGLYRHYKGNDYFVFEVATHSESRESLVVYRCLYGDYSWWVRPLSMFLETVELAGETIPRFRFVRSLSGDEQANYLGQINSESTICNSATHKGD